MGYYIKRNSLKITFIVLLVYAFIIIVLFAMVLEEKGFELPF